MKKIFILSGILLTSTIAVFASSGLTLSKSQQNRLNSVIKQLKIPTWDYRLSITTTWAILSELEPIINSTTWSITIQERIVEKVVIVEKPVIVEKIIEKPMSLCVDLSKVQYPSGRSDDTTSKILIEIAEMRTRNQILWCP